MESLEPEGKVAEEPTPEIIMPTHYLEGESVHACTQLYTHVYTTVYTRVHNIALGMSPEGPS